VTAIIGSSRRIIEVRVRPRSGKREVSVAESGGLTVSVLSPPEKGKANREVIELLAAHFGLPASGIRIVRGGQSRLKLVELTGP
jgi:uncharacterized protein (TIGR00251 family)